jgi:prolipoprotein diacylglyceryltransferase
MLALHSFNDFVQIAKEVLKVLSLPLALRVYALLVAVAVLLFSFWFTKQQAGD